MISLTLTSVNYGSNRFFQIPVMLYSEILIPSNFCPLEMCWLSVKYKPQPLTIFLSHLNLILFGKDKINNLQLLCQRQCLRVLMSVFLFLSRIPLPFWLPIGFHHILRNPENILPTAKRKKKHFKNYSEILFKKSFTSEKNITYCSCICNCFCLFN